MVEHSPKILSSEEKATTYIIVCEENMAAALRVLGAEC